MMKPMKSLLVFALLSMAACGSKAKAQDPCTRGVTHVFDLTIAQSAKHDAKPSADEQTAINAVKQQSLDACQRDGLTQAQLDCILAATDWDKFLALGACPAIKDKRPTWLLIP